MNSFYSLPYQVCSLAAETFQTSAHVFRTHLFGFSQRHVSTRPAKSGVRYPPAFAASGCNPDSGPASTMNNCQCPLCFKLYHILVRNQLSSKGIDDLDYFFLKDKFWLEPQKVYQRTKKKAYNQFRYGLQQVSCYGKTIYSKEHDQYKRNTSPNKITSRAESHTHSPIISEEGI